MIPVLDWGVIDDAVVFVAPDVFHCPDCGERFYTARAALDCCTADEPDDNQIRPGLNLDHLKVKHRTDAERAEIRAKLERRYETMERGHKPKMSFKRCTTTALDRERRRAEMPSQEERKRQRERDRYAANREAIRERQNAQAATPQARQKKRAANKKYRASDEGREKTYAATRRYRRRNGGAYSLKGGAS